MRKQHGKWWEMVRKLGKYNIVGITIIITKTKWAGFKNFAYI